MANVPDFDSLPAVEGMPQGCAWGIWDKDGKKDVYGTLNLLTPEVLAEAAKEVKTGQSASLNWPIGALETPFSGRKALAHKVLSFLDSPLALHGYDDEVEFNTQCSSQWDSLVHFHHQDTQTAYNGIKTSVEELTQNFGKDDLDQNIPTLNHWHKRGGLVARGVFVDYKLWADKQGIQYSPFECHEITVENIQAIAKEQGVEFKPGDVLIIRSGYTEHLTGLPGEKQQEYLNTHQACGVTGTDETAKWFWNQHFSAVAGDMIGFEHVPPVDKDGKEQDIKGLVLHPWFLSLFGMSIGELWYLKDLSEMCQKLGRYSFLLTSSPLNVPGSVGSPPNALAVF